MVSLRRVCIPAGLDLEALQEFVAVGKEFYPRWLPWSGQSVNCCPQFVSLSGSWSRTAPGGPDGKGAEAPDDILRQNPKSSEVSEVQNTAIACG